MTTNTESHIPGLEIFNDAAFSDKLQRFGAAGLAGVHVVFDFDHTLTRTFKHNGERAESSWGALERHLPPAERQICDDMYTYYAAKERANTMTLEDANTWWTSALAIHREVGLDLNEVEANFADEANIRPGTAELLKLLEKSDVPNVIISAGIKNMIVMWFATYNITPGLVISTELQTDDEGRVTGWDESSVVHSLNKAETNHPELDAIKQERPYTIVVGDSLHDASMAAGDDTVIRIRIVDLHPGESSDSLRGSTAERFDAMIEGGDLFPVVALTERIQALNRG